MRNTSMAFAVVLAGVFATYVQVPNAGSPTKAASGQESGTDDKNKEKDAKDTSLNAYADHPIRVLLDYLQPGQPVQKDVLDCKSVIDPGKIKVQFLFATVVDPNRTRLNLTLDRQLDAILKAAQKSGYQFQDLWLPWRLTQAKGETKEQKDAREQLPGLLTFRQTDKLLAVWLIGETPTAGLSQVQFQKAACFAHKTDGMKILGLLGPTFSGTLESLKRGLPDAGFFCFKESTNSCLNILGITTSYSAIKEFQNPFKNFRSFLHDDNYMQDRLGEYLQSQRLSGARVVVLSEGDTLFGNEFKKQFADAKDDTSAQPRISIFQDVVSYPREISRLRNAYQSDTQLTAKENAATAETRRQLLFPLQDSAGQDLVPNFSTQTPISLETQLFQIAERLRDGRFDLAVLTGSNVLDTLFLSRFLTENVPDMRVVVFDSDLLFVHGTDSLNYLGTLSVSRYPLHSQFDSTRPLDIFASMSERALYEAALRLIDDTDGTKIDQASGANLPKSNSGPLWLSVVGRGSYWPVALINSKQPNSNVDSDLEIGAPTRVWNVIFWSATLFTLYVTWLFYSALLIPSGKLSAKLALFHPNPDGVAKPKKPAAVYHLLSIIFLATAYWALACSPLRVLEKFPTSRDWLAQAAAALVVFVVLIFVAARSVSAWSVKPWMPNLVAVGTVLLLTIIGWPLAFSRSADQSGLYRAIRSVNVPSGVAPQIPVVFFLLVLGWWSWTNWLRTVFIAEREVNIPKIKELPRSIYCSLIHLLRMPIMCEMPTGRIVLALSVLCVVFGFRWIASVESPAYDALIILLLAAASTALLSTTFSFFSTWSLLRSYLKVLNTYSSQDMDVIAKSIHLPSFWTTGVEDHTFPIARQGLGLLKEISLAHYKYTRMTRGIEKFEALLHNAAEHVRSGEHIPIRDTLRIRVSPISIGKQMRALPPHPKDVMENICKIISLFHVAFIRYVLTQLRNLLSFITAGFLLTACAIHSYPFQGAGYLRWWTGVLFLVPAVAVTLVWVQMEYDPILAKLHNQKEGIDFKSWERLAAAGALPLIAGVSTLFPAVGQFLFAWVHPTLSGFN